MTITKRDIVGLRLSGNKDVTKLSPYYSSNNFMIVKFRSDASSQNTGFKFTWTTGRLYLLEALTARVLSHKIHLTVKNY